MEKKKVILLVACNIVCVSSLLALLTVATQRTLLTKADEVGVIWGHYSALQPQLSEPGSREYWISCSDHSISFTRPTTGTIEDRGQPTLATVKSWSTSDKRYLPKYQIDSKHVWYGFYPQTHVKNSTLISKLNALKKTESNGYYLYDGDYYSKVSADAYYDNITFDDNTTATDGTTCWFKVERLKWRVLQNSSDTYLVITDKAVDAKLYNENFEGTKQRTDYQGNTGSGYANNYKYSAIRSWLNTTFYNSAFFYDNNEILTTTVDNSVSSTGQSPNTYACENTSDKIFIPSVKELSTSAYGFNTDRSVADDARSFITTDYARAVGAFYYTGEDNHQFYSWDFTRSPRNDSQTILLCLGAGSGYVNSYYCWKQGRGTLPMMKLKF